MIILVNIISIYRTCIVIFFTNLDINLDWFRRNKFTQCIGNFN